MNINHGKWEEQKTGSSNNSSLEEGESRVIFFIVYIFFIFIFGCVGSSLLCTGFL